MQTIPNHPNPMTIMRDFTFGQISGRQLTLRLFAPGQFKRWTEAGCRFSPWRLLNPLAWVRAIFRGRYDWWWIHRPNDNHRCYCQVGTLLDFSLVVASWGVVVFYSNYTGDVPCVCDKVFAEIFGDEDEPADEVPA